MSCMTDIDLSTSTVHIDNGTLPHEDMPSFSPYLHRLYLCRL